jgi:glucokinase
MADQRGISGKVSEPTAKVGGNDALALQIIRLIGESCTAAGIAVQSVGSVGVSSCGPFVLNNGQVELAAPNICGGLAGKARGLPNDWKSALLEAPLRAAFPNVRVENDGVGALEAERRWGALQGFANCAYVTWSTGIGMGVCVDGHILRGKNGNAGHLGHTFVVENNEALCGCGLLGDVEALVAGNAIPRRFGVQGYADASTLFNAARAGDAQAITLIDSLCNVMGRALFNATALFDLQRISLGGSVFWHNQDYLLPRLQLFMQGKLPALTNGLEIVPAGLGERVGDFAALALVMR